MIPLGKSVLIANYVGLQERFQYLQSTLKRNIQKIKSDSSASSMQEKPSCKLDRNKINVFQNDSLENESATMIMQSTNQIPSFMKNAKV